MISNGVSSSGSRVGGDSAGDAVKSRGIVSARKRILVTLLVDDGERQALRSLAAYDHVSQSAWVRKIIREEARELASSLRKQGKRVEKSLDL